MTAPFTIGYLTGGKDAVLSNLVVDPTWLAEKWHRPNTSMERAAEIAASIAKGRLYEIIYPTLVNAFTKFIIHNGARPPFPQEQAACAEWDAAADDVMAAAFEPYAGMLSGDWLGTATVDTRIHADGELSALAYSFAKEVWAQLTYEKNTTAKILSAVGIVAEDIDAILANPQPVQDARTVVELAPDMTLNAVLNKIMLQTGPDVQLGDIEMVADDTTDEFILPQAMARLGINMDDVEAIRIAVLSGWEPDTMHDLVAAGELLDEADDAIDGATEAEGQPFNADDVTFSAAGGEIVDPPTAAPPPAGTSVAPVPETGVAVPGRPGRKPRPKNGPPVEGQIPAHVLVSLKDNANVRDEDAAAIVGVSRATYNNFVKDKTPFVPTEPQRLALRELARGKLNGLLNVMSMIDGVPYDEIE